MTDQKSIQKAYTTIMEHFIQTGSAPHYTELGRLLEVSPDEAKQLQNKAAKAGVGCWFASQTDYIESWAPFYNVPNHHRASVNGEQKWFGQCGLEALAIRWMFPGQEVRIDTTCLDCGEKISVVFKDEEIIEINPPTAVVHINNPLTAEKSSKDGSFYCSQMNIFRSEDHVKNWSLYNPISEESIMPVEDWSMVLSGPLFRNRLDSDILERTSEYWEDFLERLATFGRTGDFWK